MRQARFAFLLCLLQGVQCFAQTLQSDPRTSVLEYLPNHRWSINTAPAGTTLILFELGDHIRSIRMSDPSAFQAVVTASGDGLVLRQVLPVASTSMLITTDGHNYDLLLTSSSNLPMSNIVYFVPAAPKVLEAERPPPSLVKPLLSVFYKFKGDKRLWPKTMTDDGAKTYIRWADDQAVPAVFAVDGSGQEQTINAYMRDGVFTIDRVYERLIFRIDKSQAFAARLNRKQNHG